MKKYLLFLFLLLTGTYQAAATHIVGGEFEMRFISGNTYRLTLNLYFDLVNGNPGARDPDIYVSIFEKGTNRRVMNRLMNLRNEVNVNYTNPECALAGVLRTSKMIYYEDIIFSPSAFNHPDGYYVVWERCCRNNTINNIFDPGGTGQTFYLEFPPVWRNGQAFRNSSPVLFPPLSDYACLNELFYYDFGGTDPDGDSLVYDMVTPLRGFSSTNDPAPTASSGPYPQVSWRPGYNGANQVLGSPAINIHPTTGRLTVRPTMAGLFVFGIRCREFRNGVQIGEVRRDFQLMVRTDCNLNTRPGVKAQVKGKAGFYNTAEIIQVGPAGERCFDIKYTDPDPSTRLTLKVLPVNFSNSNYTLSGETSGIVNTGSRNDTLTATICFADCFDTQGKVFELDLIAVDDGCSQPKLDTLRLRFTMEPVPDRPPTVSLSTPDRLFTVGDGAIINFDVTANDADGDIVSLTARGVDFNMATQNITFQPGTGVGPLTTNFRWPIDCPVLQRESYKIEFSATTELCGIQKTTTEVIEVRTLFPNNAPVLTTNQQVLRFELGIDEPFEAKFYGTDVDFHELLLQAQGQGFDLSVYGMTFTATGGPGNAEGVLNWVATCEAAKAGLIRVDVLLKENACIPWADQKLTLEFLVKFPNTPPVLSTDKPDLVFELDLHEPFEANFAGSDIDLHQLMLAAKGQGFDLATYGMVFQATGGAGSTTGKFNWVANCEAAAQGIVRVDFLLQESTCIASPDQKLTMEFRVKVPDITTFIPANIFTPNGDGLNDYFEMPTLPLTNCDGTFERIRIYNRWGKEVFSSTDPRFRWDGKNVVAGVYYYLIHYTTSQYKGSVTIVY